MTTGFQHAITAGRLLLQAKAMVQHGGWLRWLEAHCLIKLRTAQAYMQLAKLYGTLDEEHAQRVAHSSFRQALKEAAKP